jgi:predicted glycoside hydrolase/deacetylase ChbG (UPF0249 family)
LVGHAFHSVGVVGHAFEPAAAALSVRSSELLGFLPDARMLIVNNDDFGMYHAINAAVVDSIEEGIASSCSLMVPCPWALHGMHLLRQRPEIPFGIHLTLFCDTTHYRWGPLTVKEKVPSLLDKTGELFTPAQIPELLRDLPVGLSEWAVHPGLGNEEAQAIDPGWRVRRTDYEFLTSPEAHELLQREGIVVIDYRTIQQAWSRTGAPPRPRTFETDPVPSQPR